MNAPLDVDGTVTMTGGTIVDEDGNNVEATGIGNMSANQGGTRPTSGGDMSEGFGGGMMPNDGNMPEDFNNSNSH